MSVVRHILQRGCLSSRNTLSIMMRSNSMVDCKVLSAVAPGSRILHVDASKPLPMTPYGKEMPSDIKLWNVERLVAGSLLVGIPAAFAIQGPVVNTLICAAVLLHAHWGIEAIVMDYGKFAPPPLNKVFHPLALALSIVAFAGLCHFNFNDIGVTEAISELWKIK